MNHLLDNFFEPIEAAIIVCDLEGTISLANKSAEDIFCKSQADLLGKNLKCLSYKILAANGSHFDLQKQVIDVVVATKKMVNVNVAIQCLTNRIRPYSCSAQLLKDLKGELSNIIMTIAGDEYKFPILFKSANLLAALIDVNGYIMYTNDWLYAITGWTQEEVIGKNWYSHFISGDSLWKMTQAYVKAENQRKNIITFKGDLLTKDGKKLNVSYTNLLLRDFNGEVNSIAIIGKDITHIGLASAAHYKSEDYFRDIFGQSNRAVFICTSSDRIQLANDAFSRLTGLSIKQSIRNPIKKMFPIDEDETKVVEMIKEAESGNTSNAEMELHRKDEAIINVLLTTSPVYVAGKNLCLGYMQDITEQKSIERERISNLRFFEYMDRITKAIQGTNNLEQMMSDVLEEVLSIFECDRASLVYPCDPDAPLWSAPMERTKPEWPGVLALDLEVPMDSEVARIFRTSRAASGPVKFGPSYKERLPADIAAEFNILSQMTMALYPKIGKPWNFIMHQCSYSRVWTSEEEKIFQEIGRRLEDGLTSLLIYRDLQKSEQKYREIFEESLDGIFVTSSDGSILDVNKRAIEIFGYQTKKEVFGLNMAQDVYANPEDRKPILETVNRRGSGEFDVFAKKKGGEKIIAHISMVAVRDKSGNVTSYRGLVRDVTEQRGAAEELRESRKQVLDILESITDGFFALDDSWRFTYINHRAEELFEIKRENLLFRNIWRILSQEESPVIFEQLHLAKKRMKTLTFEEFIPRFGKWLEMHIYSYEKGLSVYFSDITERKEAEQALAVRENEYRSLVQNIPDLIVRYDKGLRRVYVNPAWEEGSGLSAKDVINAAAAKIPKVTKPTNVEYVKKLRKVFETGIPQAIEFTWINARGIKLYLDYVIVPEYDRLGNIETVLAVGHDLTERKHIEDALKKSEAKYRRIVETANEGIWVLGPDMATTFVNLRMAEILGCSEQEMIGRRITDFMFEEDTPGYLEKMENCRQKTLGSYECRFRGKEGQEVWTTVSYTPILDDKNNFEGVFGMLTNITKHKLAEDITKQKLDELQYWQNLFLEKERQIIELKEEIDHLKKRQDKTVKP